MSQSEFLDAVPPYNSIDQPGVEDRKCVSPAKSKGFQRCGNRIHQAELAQALFIRDEIATLSSASDKLDALKRYASLRCCKALHRKMLDAELTNRVARKWLSELDGTIPQDPPPAPPPAPPSPPTASPQTNTEAEHAQARAPQRQPPVFHRYSTRSTTSTIDPHSPLTSPISAETRTPEFEDYVTRASQTVSSLLMRPLSKRDRLSGSIYLYTRESSPGFVKIGLTTTSVSERVGNWQRKCGYRPILQHQICNVPNVYRVEMLIHFQLAKHRRWERWCNGCGSRHKEWFEIEIETAVQVMNEWAQWMDAAQPYDTEGYLKNDWWRLLTDLRSQKVPEVTASVLLDSMVSDPVEENEQSNQVNESSETANTGPHGITPVATPETPGAPAPAPARPQNAADDSAALLAIMEALLALSKRIDGLRQNLDLTQATSPASGIPVLTPSPSPSLPRHDLFAPPRALTVAG